MPSFCYLSASLVKRKDLLRADFFWLLVMNKTFAVFHCNYGLVITGEDTIAEASVSAMVCECCLAPAARYKLTAVLYCRGLLLAFQTATKVFAG